MTEEAPQTIEVSPEPIKPEPEVPKPPRKIAILGSAVSSVGYAPFKEDNWEIWGCSPANKSLPRVDAWFELHNIELKKREGLTEWIEWLGKQPTVFVQQPTPDIPNGHLFPLKQLVAKYGRYYWTSQVAFMLALAIEQKPEVIGIYGVDMAANTEYNQQRLACQYFILEATKLGITVVVPPESDLLEPPPIYGYCESSRRWRKLNARKLELQGRITDLSHKEAQAHQEKNHLVGALDDLEYQLAHWANTTDFD